MNRRTSIPSVPLVVLDETIAHDYARSLFDRDIPLGVISSTYYRVLPFMLYNNGHTVAVVADADDPGELAEAIVIVERRLGRVNSVVRYASDLPRSEAS
ncbi:hypothetical protein RD149_15715 [Gordonia westfalica]|uniref:ACT domain-containing protein n=1 Tax=Gordonia westfalica TaxID=158898 RepID=A0ABU2GUS5_9ACTN|nr:hypothetical protein [Gordonia westfalica]MDS1115211.1 hypothetical protein [Gordonia westfalica]